MKSQFFIFFFVFVLGVNLSNAQPQNTLVDCIFQPEDRKIAEEKLMEFSSKSKWNIADLIPEIGLSFLGTPYVGATLENGQDEKMVINLRELDCTTFAENCLALARTVKLGKTDFESFVSELERIRYRDGIRNQYLSRLHYFSDWIHNNSAKQIVSEKPNLKGEKLDKTINFMSTHADKYPVLKSNPQLVASLALQEQAVSSIGFHYFPKSNPQRLLSTLRHGDIIGLTTSVEGLDITHVGIIVKKDKRFHLLHASLSGKKVVLSEGPVTDFIKPESKNTGIVIARPLF